MATPSWIADDEMVFGALPIQPVEIVDLLRRISPHTVDGYGKPKRKDPNKMETHKDTTPYKRAIFSVLKEHLDKIKGEALFTDPAAGKSEFMLDFLWLDEVNKYHQRALMGMECEWTRERSSGDPYEAVRQDFTKLLHFKAPPKLLVSECPDDCRDGIREMLRTCLLQFELHVKGECYLFVEFLGIIPERLNEPFPQEAWEFQVEARHSTDG